jgi:glyoxylase-like metal-dependent hydrolase (beta-lactamase superfamily II)
MMSTTNWDPAAPADQVTSTIWTSSGVTDSHLVTTPGGDVIINTGFHYQGARHRERYEQAIGRSLDVRKIVFTQGYFEQIGGWPHFTGPGVETIAQQGFYNTLGDQRDLAAFFQPRNRHVLHPLVPTQAQAMERIYSAGDPTIDTVFADSHAFEVGGRRFELYSIPGGEALDGLVVWVPDERVAFTGNMVGALYGALPHLYTIRGARIRSARLFLQSCQRVLDLQPEIHITGHDEPIIGAARIQSELGKVMSAVRYLHDRTLEGMNAGTDLWTLMNEIRLPADLEPLPGRGPVWWYVRTIWEEYSGWARFESTTELYPVPARSVWADVVEMSGGVDRVAERAQQHLDGGRPLQAVHLIDMTLSVDPRHRPSLAISLAAHEQLLDEAGNNFDELGYLESEVAKARAALDAAI